MSKLNTADVFAGIRLLKKLGAVELITKITEESKDLTADELGKKIIYALLDAATEEQGEAELYKFLSHPFGVPADQIAELDADVFLQKLKDSANLREWVDFFQHAVSMLTGTT